MIQDLDKYASLLHGAIAELNSAVHSIRLARGYMNQMQVDDEDKKMMGELLTEAERVTAIVGEL